MAKSKLTDEMLRVEIEAGLNASQIAAKYGLARQSVHERVRKLSLTTTAVAVVAPVESRIYVRGELDVLKILVRSLERMQMLADACHEWALDANNPTRYDLGPRANEVMVTIFEPSDEDGRMRRVKKPLHVLLKLIEDEGTLTDGAETRIADNRELMLKVAQELRQSVQAGVDLAARIADARAMQALREALLAEIAKVAPDVAERIAQAVRRILILHSAGGGPDPVSHD